MFSSVQLFSGLVITYKIKTSLIFSFLKLLRTEDGKFFSKGPKSKYFTLSRLYKIKKETKPKIIYLQ